MKIVQALHLMRGLLGALPLAALCRGGRSRFWCGFALLTFTFSTAYAMAPRREDSLRLRHDFLWGAAGAAHQVEGGNTNNDWWEWEQLGRSKASSGRAVDFYNRYDEDFALAEQLGHNAHRLSIEWSRVNPEMGVFSEKEIEHYRRVLTAARARGLKTFVTLHHFTNPLWVARFGGWESDAITEFFERYVIFVTLRLGDLVDYWVTINEPTVNTLLSYVVGVTPPGRKDMAYAGPVLSRWLKAHARAYRVIHALQPQAKVGFAHHMRVFAPARWWHVGDRLLARFIMDFWNRQFLTGFQTGQIEFSIPTVLSYKEEYPELKGTIDFIGVNYYTRDLIKLDLDSSQGFAVLTTESSEKNDLGWEIYPEGFYEVLAQASSFGWPVYVTENGLADASDSRRARFLCSHLREMAKAIDDGMDIRGYLHWSLVDNYEWVEGFEPRFGLIEIDYNTLERKIRPSARTYESIIRSNSLNVCASVDRTVQGITTLSQ